MREIVTLAELKSWMAITETTHDTFLETIRDVVTQFVESYTRHEVITRQHINYYNGFGKQALLLDHYPVYVTLDSDFHPSNVTLYDDTNRDYGSADLIDSSDYWIAADKGLVTLYDDEHLFSNSLAAVKITYWAGFSRFYVIDEENNYIDISDTGGTAAVEITPVVNPATRYPGFSAEELASTIQTALNADGTLSGTYTVSYSHVTQKFTVSADVEFSLLTNTGSNSSKAIWGIIGMSTTADKTSASTYAADTAVTGAPNDLQLASFLIAERLFADSKRGLSKMDIVSKALPQAGGTLTYTKDLIPKVAQEILEHHRRIVG